MTTMLRLATLLIALFCCFLTGQIVTSCAHTKGVDPCVASAQLVSAVDQALGTDDYEDQLAHLSAAVCAIETAVKEVVALAGQKTASKIAEDPVEEKKYANGTAWLAKHGGK